MGNASSPWLLNPPGQPLIRQHRENRYNDKDAIIFLWRLYIPVDGAHFFNENGEKVGELEVGTNWPFEIYLVSDKNIEGFNRAMQQYSSADRWNWAMNYSVNTKYRIDRSGKYYIMPKRNMEFWAPQISETAKDAILRTKFGKWGSGSNTRTWYEQWIYGIPIRW